MLPLRSPNMELAVGGGKGVNLASLLHGGFPVPPGFVVTTSAYRLFLEANDLAQDVVRLARAARADDPASLESTAREIGGRFGHGTVPAALEAEILTAYAGLGGAPADEVGALVAVRSSATAEDLPDASFAGQQETLLGVRGEAELLHAVVRCWSGLWSARALAYRARRGVDPAAVAQAVVIQRMIAAEASGVLCTADPLSGSREALVINAAWGGGDAVVDGRVTPDLLVVEKATGRVTRALIAEKLVKSVLAERGTVQVPVVERERRAAVLTDTQVAELLRLALAVETHFRAPQDVEWVIAGGRVHLLQSRPMTALPEPGAPPETPPVPGDDAWPALGERPAQPFDLWTQANVGEVWPGPVTPLTWSSAPVIVGAGVRHAVRGLPGARLHEAQWAKRFYGRIYYNEGALAHALSDGLGLPGSFIDSAVGGRRGVARTAGVDAVRLLRAVPFLLRRIVGQFGTGRELRVLFARIDAWSAEHAARDPGSLDDTRLWRAARTWGDRLTHAMGLYTELSTAAMATFALFDRMCAAWLESPGHAHRLVGGLSGVRTAEMGSALAAVAAEARAGGVAELFAAADPASVPARLRTAPGGAPVARRLDDFLERYGHHCPDEGELLYPRWAEAPEQVVEIVAGYLRAGDRLDLEGAVRRQRADREAAEREALSALGPARRALFRPVLARSRELIRLRDEGKHYYMKAALPIRRIWATLAARWAERGWLAEPDDFFFLSVADVERVVEAGTPVAAGLDLEALVRARRAAFVHWRGVDAPRALDAAGQPVDTADAEAADEPGVLRGLPVCGGRARGPARVVLEVADLRLLRPGEVLVARATDPGWTLVFPVAAALVVEVGGQLSHAAIVAREYGLPAVAGVRDATRRIRDGEIVSVDGDTGRVVVDAPDAPPVGGALVGAGAEHGG